MAINTLKIFNTNHLVDLATLPEYDDFSVIDISLPVLKLQAEQTPVQFLDSLKLPVYIKNIDAAPEVLVSLVNSVLDLDKVIASCSQNYYLKLVSERENLSSKVSFINLPIREEGKQEEKVFAPETDFIDNLLSSFNDAAAKSNIYESILKGWAFNGDNNKIANYLSEILRTDIMGKTTVSDELKYYRFMTSVAAMAGTVMNYTTLANNIGITPPTAKIWLKFLEGTGLVYSVSAIENITGKRLMKAPKVYFRDTGVCCYLMQIKDSNELIQSLYFKKLFENFVMNLIRESYIENQEEISWRFYRDSNAKEISAIIERDNMLYPVMIDLGNISSNKLNKTFDIIKGYCEENNLELGTGSFISLGKKTCELKSKNAILQIDVNDLIK